MRSAYYSATLALLWTFAAGCQVTLPPGVIECGPRPNECPEGWGCVSGLCVEGDGDAGHNDAARDAGPDGEAFDAGQDGVEPTDDTGLDVPIPELDAGPTEPPVPSEIIAFGGPGDDDLEAMYVDDDAIYIAGTTDDSDGFTLGGIPISNGGGSPGIFIARLDHNLTPRWIGLFPGVNLAVGGITVLGDEVLVAATGSRGENGPDALLLKTEKSDRGGEEILETRFASSGDDSLVSIASDGTRWCAVGAYGGPMLAIGVLDVQVGGFIVCSDSFNGTKVGAFLPGDAPGDIAMTNGTAWVAGTSDGSASVLRVSADTAMLQETYTGDMGSSVGRLVAPNGATPHLLGRISEPNSMLWYNVMVDVAGPGGADNEVILETDMSFVGRDMTTSGGTLFLVGSFALVSMSLPLAGVEHQSAFLAEFDSEGVVNAWGADMPSVLSAVAVRDSNLWVAGTALGRQTFPALPEEVDPPSGGRYALVALFDR